MEATIPRDAGKEFTIRLVKSGALQGTIANFSQAAFRRRPYRLLLDQVRTLPPRVSYEIAINPANGTFEVKGVEPATYRILFTGFEGETAVTVEIQPGKTVTVKLDQAQAP